MCSMFLCAGSLFPGWKIQKELPFSFFSFSISFLSSVDSFEKNRSEIGIKDVVILCLGYPWRMSESIIVCETVII